MKERNRKDGSVGWTQHWVTPEPQTDEHYIRQVMYDIQRHDRPPVQYVKSLLRQDPYNEALMTLRRTQKYESREEYISNIRRKLRTGADYIQSITPLKVKKRKRLESELERLEEAQTRAWEKKI